MSHVNDLRPTKIRKSRALKRSPVTVLNADVSNFRALVQQLTGRPSAATRFRSQRGPLNINFRQSKEANMMLPLMYHQHLQRQEHYFQQQFVTEHEEHMMSSTSGQSKGSIVEFCDKFKKNNNQWDEFDDLDVEGCLEDLAWVATTNVDESGV
ncbi:VQ motif-containing protein 22 [Bienertia sinuspersici]